MVKTKKKRGKDMFSGNKYIEHTINAEEDSMNLAMTATKGLRANVLDDCAIILRNAISFRSSGCSSGSRPCNF